MDMNDLADEYKSIKAYCRQEAAKSFKHPMAKDDAQEESSSGENPTDVSDEELEALLSEG